jgi:integrase
MKHASVRGIYLRGSIYWLNFQRHGKRSFVSLETNDFTEACKRAANVRAAPGLQSSIGFPSEIDAFLAYKRRKNQFTASSAHGRGYILRAFARECGKISPVYVTPNDVARFYDDRLHRFSASTANSYAMILRSFFNWCVQVAHILRQNPCQGLELAEEQGTRMRDFCTESQRDLLISTCTRDDLLFVFYCGFHAGLRKNEIIEARPFWFDLGAGLLHLRKTSTINFKDREERTVPLTIQFLEFLKGYRLREPYMLAPKVVHGKNRYRYDFTRPFKEHAAMNGLGWVTPHTMRHTFASLLASAGVSLYKISVWMGDDPRVVDRRYARLKPRDEDIEKSHGSRSEDASVSRIST